MAGQNCLLFRVEDMTYGEPHSSNTSGIRPKSTKRTAYPRSLTVIYKILRPSYPQLQIPKPTPKPPHRNPITNDQGHNLPNLILPHNIVYNLHSRIRHLYTHRMLRNGLHLKPDIIPTKIKRLGRAPGRLLLDPDHLIQDVEKEELVFQTAAPPFTDV